MTKDQKIETLNRKLGQFRSLYNREKQHRKTFSKGIPRFPRLRP